MRKLITLLLGALLVMGCRGGDIGQVNPKARLDPDQIYIVAYWDVDLPQVLDPHGQYRPAVEELIAEFMTENPGIRVEPRWLTWTEAEGELARALKEGVPPDLWGDWQGLARHNHPLQIAAELWTDSQLLTPAGRKSVFQEDQIWAWPRWTWPRGLLALADSIGVGAEVGDAGWDWQQLGSWLKENQLTLDVNDWQGEFSCQALLAATGHPWPNWGGQEVHQLFATLERLRNQGVLSGDGEYKKITEGKIIVGGFTPALVTWLCQGVESELALLPLPGISNGASTVPVSSSCLVQFRQQQYKGDDHSLAAAMVAEFLARKQGVELAELLWAAPAWEYPAWNPQFPEGYVSVLKSSIVSGVPLRALDVLGRQGEDDFRTAVTPVLQDFWRGLIDYQGVAARLEGLQ